MTDLELRVVSFEHADAAALMTEVRAEYAARYGAGDATPMTAGEFAAPSGLFLVAYAPGEPLGCGGWRAHPDGSAEIKRMYVRRTARGRGLSRVILAELERTARGAGHRRIVLETGPRRPEAIALYHDAGYTPGEPFGRYACDVDALFFTKDLEAPDGDLRAG